MEYFYTQVTTESSNPVDIRNRILLSCGCYFEKVLLLAVMRNSVLTINTISLLRKSLILSFHYFFFLNFLGFNGTYTFLFVEYVILKSFSKICSTVKLLFTFPNFFAILWNASRLGASNFS